MLSKRKSLNDDLIIWHGMTKQNISTAVRSGLPFAVRRRKVWLDIVAAEVQKKSKSIVAQAPVAEEESSFVHVDLETRVKEIMEALPHDLPIRIDKYNASIAPSIYKHFVSLDVSRDFVWQLFEVCLTDRLPLVLRVRIVDWVLVSGCVVLVSVMLSYVLWRQEAFLTSITGAEVVEHVRSSQKAWLKDDELEAFWQRCVENHNHNFLSVYVNMTSLMRLKNVSMGRQRVTQLPILRQFQEEIYSHRNYSWIGFDVDHTLVEYKLPILLKASFDAAVKELQQSFIGLRAIQSAKWIPEIAQRGIAIDTNRGNFLHIAEDGTIQRAYHGSHEVSYYSINMLYGVFGKQDLAALGSSRLIYLYTAADIIFAPLYAWIVDAFDSGVIVAEEMGASLYVVPDIDEDRVMENPNDPFLANRTAYISLSTFAQRAARSYYANTFWKTICSTPEVLIQPNIEIRDVLESLRSTHHKQLFVLTNGSWTHCNEVMKVAIGKDWVSFFDLIVTEAKKEIFFDELNDMPFMEVDPGTVVRAQKRVVLSLERGRIYAGGNVHTLMKFFNTEKGELTDVILPPRICYFGDHVLQDVKLPAKNGTGWDLVAIIKEINNVFLPPDKDEQWSLTDWLFPFLSREAAQSHPDVYGAFFFLGRTGTASYLGKQVCDTATLCLPSVAKLARRQVVLKLSMLQQGMSRYSTSNDIKSLSKRPPATQREERQNAMTVSAFLLLV
ncbi:hypothetical protein ATCC90586_009427 [Pythium insidiosum]|nr:hypothetical protein ATCC90586_009427 [Pythium insidiosum]